MLTVSAIPAAGALLKGRGAGSVQGFHNQLFEVGIVGSEECLWSYRLAPSGQEHRIAPPVFNIDNRRHAAVLANVKAAREPRKLPNGSVEYSYEGMFASHPDLSLVMLFQVAVANPIVRFSYVLKSAHRQALTKPSGGDDLQYLGISFQNFPEAKEIRLSSFRDMYHSYVPEEVLLEPRAFADRVAVMGPVVTGLSGHESLLVAYEHGSQAPDAFLRFQLLPDRHVALQAVKGNYLTEPPIDSEHPFHTLWFEAGAVAGGEDELASAFRAFVLEHMAQDATTRKPRIYYNTWNRQERDRWWYGKEFSTPINTRQILEDIDIAHRMGIEVYVIDAGWSDKAGDWTVNLGEFPDGLHSVKARLDRYGMQLGLWFGPCSASGTSKVLREYQDCLAMAPGEKTKPTIGNRKRGYRMCLVSRYIDAFTERMIELSKQVGVNYFKWDGLDMHTCDAPGHWHGDEHHTPEERAESHDFQMIQQLTRSADRLVAACPGTVVDIDVTEPGRTVGLSFLSTGRFFAINNGPYYSSYNIPSDRQHYSNVFVYPGPARTWVCRSLLPFDKWVPSVLFLTHYFPDDPLSSQEINVASLILGQNGIWGDLPRVSDAGVRYIRKTLALYQKVRDDMAAADPVLVGHVSGSPEIHEKIHARTGRGAVVVFAMAEGKYTYVTSRRVSSKYWASEGVTVRFDSKGRARLDLDFRPGKTSRRAKIVFFGTD